MGSPRASTSARGSPSGSANRGSLIFLCRRRAVEHGQLGVLEWMRTAVTSSGQRLAFPRGLICEWAVRCKEAHIRRDVLEWACRRSSLRPITRGDGPFTTQVRCCLT